MSRIDFEDIAIEILEFYFPKYTKDDVARLGRVLEMIQDETAVEIFEKIHAKEGYYPMGVVGISNNDIAMIASDFEIKYGPDGIEVV